MEFCKIIAYLLALQLATAQFVVSASAKDSGTGEAKKPEISKASESPKEDIVKNPLRPPDTSSPRATLRSFLQNINRAYAMLMNANARNMTSPGVFTSESVEQMERHAGVLLQRSAYCLNLSEVPDELKQDVGYEGAIILKEILDRIEVPPFEAIPDVKPIEAKEGKEKITELNRWRLPNTDIIISKVKEGPRMGEFLFEPKTVARLSDFYDKVQDLPYKQNTEISHYFLNFYEETPGLLLPPKWYRWVPPWLTGIYFEQPLWQWAALFILPITALLVVWMVVRSWHRRANKFSTGIRYVGWVSVVLFAVVSIFLIRYILDEHLNVTGPMRIFVENTLQKIFIIVLACLVLWEVLKTQIYNTIKAEVPEEESWGEEMGSGGSRSETLMLLLRKFLMIVMFSILGLLLLSSMGINIGPLLAGAGVVGLAIGFGAQTLVRDIIAGVFFLMDDAFRVGDYIETGSMKGRVEHISIRSLRLRHPRGMLITVPFGDMQSVTNYTRDYVIMKLDFRVRYDTDVEKVRKIVKKINKEIQKDPELSKNLLDKIKSQGVREMDDSAMIMRVKFMCVPGEQFVLRREVYRRIQEAFQKKRHRVCASQRHGLLSSRAQEHGI